MFGDSQAPVKIILSTKKKTEHLKSNHKTLSHFMPIHFTEHLEHRLCFKQCSWNHSPPISNFVCRAIEPEP